MEYSSRPAFRNDWFQFLLIIACLVAAAGFGLGAIPLLQPELWALAMLVLLAVAGVIVLVLLFQHFQWRFSIRDGTIESSRGFIGRDVHSIRVRDLRNVNVRQSLWQRILGVGDVEFSSAGGEGIEVTFRGVAAPMQLKERVQALQ